MSWKRLLSRLGTTALFLLNAALAIGMVTAIPVLADAVSRRIIQQELGLFEQSIHRSPFTVRVHASPSSQQPIGLPEVDSYGAWLAQQLVKRVGVPIASTFTEIHSSRYDLIPRAGDPRYTEPSIDAVYIVWSDGVEDQIRVIAGAPFGEDADAEVLAVWLQRSYADELALDVGETYEIGNVYDKSSSSRVVVRIAGIWEPLDPDATFWWYTEPMWHYEGILLTSRQEYEAHIYPVLPRRIDFISWRFVLDDKRMNLSRAQHYIDGLQEMQLEVSRYLPAGTIDQAPTNSLLRGQKRKASLSLILLGFNVPLMVLIFYFMGAVASTLAQTEAQETAMLISRGSSRWQSTWLALLETLLVLTAAVPAGLLLGLALAYSMGYSFSFLRFTIRVPLAVSLVAVDWRLCATAIAMIMIWRLVPTWANSGRSIVIQERESARRHIGLSGIRLMLIAFLSAATIYAYRQLAQVGTLGLVSWEPSDPTHDPLLLLAPSLFLVTAPLLVAELFILLIRPLAWIGCLAPSTVLYLGSLNLSREGWRYRTPVYMLVLCLSLGVFYASLAKSADAWLLDHRRYEVGSDLRYDPRGTVVVAGRFGVVDEEGGPVWESAAILPVNEYEKVEGVLAAAPVGEYEAAIAIPKEFFFVRLLAIERLSFGRVAYYRADYSAEPLGELMNRLGMQEDGILIPTELGQRLQLGEGDTIRLNVLVDQNIRESMAFTIVGTFDYFPTMFPDEAAVLVANLEYVQLHTVGLLPYGLWMRTIEGMDGGQIVQGIIRRLHVLPERVIDLHRMLAEDQARMERVAIFGVLSLCFLTAAFLAAGGLLLHSVTSLRARSLRLAVLQALGMTRQRLLFTVLIEYAGVLLCSVAIGTALGILGARLYVPFFQLAEEAGIPIPPYVPLIDNARALLMALVMAGALILTGGIILVRLMRTRVFEVLRMGMRA